MTTLSGKITIHGDKPATNAVAELHNETGDIVDQLSVDEEGRYRFYVSPGSWSLRAWDPHGHRGAGSVRVSEGETKTLDISLDEPAGSH
jgi:hypothetical protein